MIAHMYLDGAEVGNYVLHPAAHFVWAVSSMGRSTSCGWSSWLVLSVRFDCLPRRRDFAGPGAAPLLRRVFFGTLVDLYLASGHDRAVAADAGVQQIRLCH